MTTRARDTDLEGEVDEPWNSFGGASRVLGNHTLGEAACVSEADERATTDALAKVSEASAGAVAR